MDDSGLTILGIPECQSNLLVLMRTVRQQVADALYNEALRILELVKLRVPVNTGSLRDTGKVSDPVITDSEISVTISFGGSMVDYAIPVHEKLGVRHLHGQSKFLESVMLEELDVVAVNIVSGISL